MLESVTILNCSTRMCVRVCVCVRERESVCMLEGERVCVSLCVYFCVSGTEKERELVSMCVSQCVCVCVCVSRGSILYTIVLECVRERERVCVC